jgi:hypothetical protein
VASLQIGKTSQHVLLLDKEQQRFRLKMSGGMKWIVVCLLVRAENLSGEPDRRLMREMREEGGTQRLLQNRLGPAQIQRGDLGLRAGRQFDYSTIFLSIDLVQ